MHQVNRIVLVSLLWLGFAMVNNSFASGDVAAGAEAYKRLKCAKCHGDGGKGDGPTVEKLKARGKDIEMHDWTDKAFMSKLEDDYLKDITTKGGKGVGKSKGMPSYQKKLQDGDLEHLLTFIRSL